MSRLMRLVAEGRRLVTPELIAGHVRYDLADVQQYLEPLELELRLDDFDAVVARQIAAHDSESTAIDVPLAVDLHRTLPLSRRVASDPGMWRFLTVVCRPEYVPFRWALRSHAQIVRRYWAHGTRFDCNAFCRLWWIAELTLEPEEDDPYAMTRRVLASQPLATSIFVRSLAHYKPAVRAIILALDQAPSDQIARVLKTFGRWSSIVPLETQSEARLRTVLDEILENDLDVDVDTSALFLEDER